MARLIGGPLDGSTIAMDDDLMTFEHVAAEPVGVAPIGDPDDVTIATMHVRYTYARSAPGADLTVQED